MNHEQQDMIDGLLKWWLRKWGPVHGQRNANMFKLAAAFNDYGIPELVALPTCLQFIDLQTPDPFTANEITSVVRSAYQRTPSGTKQWKGRGRQKGSATQVPERSVLTSSQRALIIEALASKIKEQASNAAKARTSPLADKPLPDQGFGSSAN